MKSIIMPKTAQSDEQTNHQLVQESEEKVANVAIGIETEIFTASQLWNQQRQMRSASDRIRKWNFR